MAASSATLYFGFLIVSIVTILWMIFILSSRLFAWMLSRMLGISVGFRFGSWKCLQDVLVKSETGAFESVSAGEIKFAVGFVSGELNIQVLICDLRVVMSLITPSSDLYCGELSLAFEVGYDRAVGMVVIRNMDIVSENVTMNLEDDFFSQSKQSSATASSAKQPHQEPQLSTLAKYSTYFPEKVSFSLLKLDVRCVSVNREHVLSAENNVTGITLRSTKSKFVEDTGEITRLDVQMELNEIHLFRVDESSILEITKAVVVSSIEIPIQPVLPINVEVEIKLGGTRCNLFISRLEPWLHLLFLEKKNPVLQGEIRTLKAADMKTIMWRSTVSAPEMTVMLYCIDDLPLYHLCSQSSHLFANNISSIGTAVDVELGELYLLLADEYRERFRENILGTEPNSGSLMHIANISLNWARRDSRNDLVHSVSVTRMSIYLSYKRVESLITNAISFKDLFKTLSVSGEKTNKTGVQLSDASEEGIRLDNMSMDDPKSENYGTPSTASEECKRLKYSVSLEITLFSFSLNKDKHSIRMKFSRAKSIYLEHQSCSKVTLFDMHNAKLIRLSGGLDVHYLLSATDISFGWEPDVHLSFYEMFLRLRSLAYAQRLKEHECGSDSVNEESEKESIFAIDVETLTISAQVGDGVEAKFEAQSIFTENACIGVLVEGPMLAFNGSQVMKTTRMQISRIPTTSLDLSDVVPVRKSGPWDWVVQGLDVNICMPYKLQLRVIADSIEEMLGGLRLITAAKEENIFQGNRESLKPKKSSTNFGRIRLCIRRLTAYIEEEPIQGWLDEHYQLMKKEACELGVRLRFLEDFIQHCEAAETSDASGERKMTFDGVEIDVRDCLAINKVKERIHKRSFQSYYHACQGLVRTEGSGSCNEGFQAGFKPSDARNSLLSVCATELDLSLTSVCGGNDDAGLMDVLKQVDRTCEEISGSKVDLKTGSLVVKLRNYTLPLFSATSCKCEGRIMTFPIAQQPQISQDVFVGNDDPTPPMKTYSDLRINFEQGEVSFGVGYEPAFADISNAFTVALSQRNPSVPQDSKEEQSLPWWDNMRSYVHDNITLSFSESKWTVLATTDPYESQDKLQIATGPIEFQQSDGRVFVDAKDFKINLSSLESLVSRHSLNVPDRNSGVAFFEAPVFNLEVTMDWGHESESSSNVLDPFRSTSLSLRWNFSLRPKNKNECMSPTSPTMNIGAHDLAWILKFCGMYCDPPHKLRSFSGWPRFGVSRVAIPEGLSLDQVMTEFMFRVEATPFLIKYMPSDSDDPANGLTYDMTKLKYELCYSRGKQRYTLKCKREDLELVYQGLELHVPKAFIKQDEDKGNKKHCGEGFILSSDYLTVRRHAPNADHKRLLAWKEAGKGNLEKTYVQSQFENRRESAEHRRSDSSDDDDGYNVVLADNCQRVYVYGLKLLWTIENRDAVFSFVGGISEAFQPPKPSPSRQYTQRKIFEENQKDEEISRLPASPGENQTIGKVETSGSDEEGTCHFMVNVIEPQFNLHTEGANFDEY